MSTYSTGFAGPPRFSRGIRFVLGPLVAIYLAQIIVQNWLHLPVLELLGWWGLETGAFLPWQPLTAFLLSGPEPVTALIDWVVIYFLFPATLQQLGRRGVISIFATSWAVAVAASLALQFVGAVTGLGPYVGPGCFITAMLVVFGLSNPEAQIRLYFLIPIKAVWVAWGTGFVALLFLLFSRNLFWSVAFFGWLGSVAWMWSGGRLRVFYHRLRMRFSRKGGGASGKKGRFDVIDGGRKGRDDGPYPYH